MSAQPPADADVLDTTSAVPIAIRGGILRTAGFVGGLLLTLATAPLVIRHLGEIEYGRYSAVLAVVAIVAGLTEGGVNTVALRALSVEVRNSEQDRMMSDLLGLRLALSTLGLLAAVAFSTIAGYGAGLVLGTLLAGLGMVALLTQSLFATVLQRSLRFGLATLVDFSRQLVATAMIVVVVVAGGGPVALLAVGIPAGVGSLLLAVMLVRGMTVMRPAFHPRRWMPLMRETLVFAAATAVNSLYFRVTLVIASLVTSPLQTGYFAISFRVIEVLIAVPSLLVGAAFPIIVRSIQSDRDRFESGVARLFELGVLVGSFLSVALFLVAPFAIEVLLGEPHHPSVGVLQIQSLALVASFITTTTGYPLLGMRRYREILVTTFCALLMAVVLTLGLAPSMGATGAAVAAVSADLTLALATTLLLRRSGGPALSFTVLPVAILASAAGVFGGIVVGVHPVLQTVVGGTAYLVVLAALGWFPDEIRGLLRSRDSPAPGH